jgi:hypothetical protein
MSPVYGVENTVDTTTLFSRSIKPRGTENGKKEGPNPAAI